MIVFYKGEIVDYAFTSRTYIDIPECYNEAAIELYNKLTEHQKELYSRDGDVYELIYTPAQLTIKKRL